MFFLFSYLSKVSNTDLNLSIDSRGWANTASSPAQHSEHNHSDSNSAANMPARWHFCLLFLSTTVSGTWPSRDDLGLHKAYPAQHAYFIPLFHSYILSIKGPSLCGWSLESRIWIAGCSRVPWRTFRDGSHGEKDVLAQLLMLHPAHKAVGNLKSLLKTSEVFLPQGLSI